ncbi:MAG: Fic family protein [Lachnospiraceae bacterium]|nr:Fic family protein [Lachnospiraceae bacterium]
MTSYIPPYEITDKILSLAALISEKIGQITERNNLESKLHLRKNNKIRSIYSSLRIEANSLSLNEVKDVINGKTVLGTVKEIQEVKNAYAAYEEIPEIDPYSISELKRIHGIMTKYIVDESGTFRQGEEGVFNGDTCIFIAPPARGVPGQMQELFDWMRGNKEKIHPLILAAVFHYEFVFIHPFSDGNGRMARLWHTVMLSKWKPVFEYIPLESQIEKFQDGYYEAIAKSHINGNSTCFVEFMLEQINLVLEEIRSQPGQPDESISKYVKKLLEVMEYDTAYTAGEILKLLNLKSKDTLRKNYLNPALDRGLIQMTIPDTPKSKNQRYIRR